MPSHGVRAYGQAHAIDILHPSPAGAPTSIGWAVRTRRADQYSCFGAPVLAVAHGTVVTTLDARRDHRARDTWPALISMMTVEAIVRELGGASWLLGNHVVVAHEDATFSVYAHLRRGSVQVRRGERVAAGQQVGAVGSSGNTSEPHLHFQLMDRARPTAAAGIPFRWTMISMAPDEIDPTRVSSRSAKNTDRESVVGVPANGQIFTVVTNEEEASG